MSISCSPLTPRNIQQGVRLWHGSRAWSGAPQIHPPRNGRAEWGAGIYCTTRYLTASKYSKGGGIVMEMTIDPDATQLSSLVISADEMIAMTKSIHRLGQREEIVRQIRQSEARRGGKPIELAVLRNLILNNGLMKGSVAIQTTEILVSHGAQIDVGKAFGNEEWACVFDPKSILGYRPRPARSIELSEYELPCFAAQKLQLTKGSSLRQATHDADNPPVELTPDRPAPRP